MKMKVSVAFKHQTGLLFKKVCRSKTMGENWGIVLNIGKRRKKNTKISPQTVFQKITGSRCILVTSYLPELSPETIVVMVNVTTRWEREEWACTSVGCLTLSCRPLLTRCKNSDAFSTVLGSKETSRRLNWLTVKSTWESWQLRCESEHFYFPTLLTPYTNLSFKLHKQLYIGFFRWDIV